MGELGFNVAQTIMPKDLSLPRTCRLVPTPRTGSDQRHLPCLAKIPSEALSLDMTRCGADLDKTFGLPNP